LLIVLKIIYSYIMYLQRLLFSYPARLLSPVQSTCGRCHMPWSIVDGHITEYKVIHKECGCFEATEGCFPLCESCWHDLTPEKRLQYYEIWWKSTRHQLERANIAYEDDWEYIKQAVSGGY
jgi:hypothetical protein